MHGASPSVRLVASAQATLGNMPADPTPLALWLRAEMPKRGYPLEGPRAGGITRLADAAGISRGSMSRIVSGQNDASIDALRKIGQVLGYSLGDMMIHAGLATPEDVATQGTAGPVRAAADTPRPNPNIPSDIRLADLEDWVQDTWRIRGLTVEQRKTMILFGRLLRGELGDDTGAYLLLSNAISREAEKHLRERTDPPQAG